MVLKTPPLSLSRDKSTPSPSSKHSNSHRDRREGTDESRLGDGGGGLSDSDGSLSDLEAGILSSGSHGDSSSGGSISDSESEDKEMAAIMEVGDKMRVLFIIFLRTVRACLPKR